MPDSHQPRQLLPRTPDEWISGSRLALAAMLWLPALLRKPRIVAAGIALSAGTDMADGLVSRIRGSRSDYSRQLDAIADSAIMLSSLGWLALARPGSLAPLHRTLAAIGLIAPMLLAIEWRRYHMLGALHIDSARAAAVVGHLYVLNRLWRDVDSHVLRRLFQVLLAGGIVESAWVILGAHLPADRSARPLLQAARRILVG